MSRVFSHLLFDFSYDAQFGRALHRYDTGTLVDGLQCKAHTLTGESSVCISSLISRGSYADFALTLSKQLTNGNTRKVAEDCRRAYTLIRQYFTTAEIPELEIVHQRLYEHYKSTRNPLPMSPDAGT